MRHVQQWSQLVPQTVLEPRGLAELFLLEASMCAFFGPALAPGRAVMLAQAASAQAEGNFHTGSSKSQSARSPSGWFLKVAFGWCLHGIHSHTLSLVLDK